MPHFLDNIGIRKVRFRSHQGGLHEILRIGLRLACLATFLSCGKPAHDVAITKVDVGSTSRAGNRAFDQFEDDIEIVNDPKPSNQITIGPLTPVAPEPPRQANNSPLSAAKKWTPPQIEPSRLEAAGIRRIVARHITLFTDVPSSKEIDSLPRLFDEAVIQWRSHFGLSDGFEDWHVSGCLMSGRARFEACGLLPDFVGDFQNGYALGYSFWMYDQTSPYYRRHLFFHEGTHAVFNTRMRLTWPPWLVEGAAEWLATHRLHEGKLELGRFPSDPALVPRLGRIEAIQEAFREGRALPLSSILELRTVSHANVDDYAWCWAAYALLHEHPAYRKRFRNLCREKSVLPLAKRLQSHFEHDRERLLEEWQIFVAMLDYGYDFERTVIDFAPGRPLAEEPVQVTVRADRGWQNSGRQLHGHRKYEIAADGRYSLGNVPRNWWCEPNGVTVSYYQGKPLGVLLAAVRPDDAAGTAISPLAFPLEVGLKTTIEPNQSGTLYFRINESAGQLADNQGTLNVTVRSAPR